MDKEWFFSWGEHQFGPFSAKELKNLAAIGRLQPGDSVWKTGMVVSVLAACIKHLFPVLPIPIVVVAACVPSAPPHSLPADGVLPANEIPASDPTQSVSENIAPQAESVVVTVIPECPAKSNAPAYTKDGRSLTTSGSLARDTRVEPKKKNIVAKVVRGAILLSQDGGRVNFRKKCVKCGYEDAARSTLPIRNGPMRTTFFCPTCRKSQCAELLGSAK